MIARKPRKGPRFSPFTIKKNKKQNTVVEKKNRV